MGIWAHTPVARLEELDRVLVELHQAGALLMEEDGYDGARFRPVPSEATAHCDLALAHPVICPECGCGRYVRVGAMGPSRGSTARG